MLLYLLIDRRSATCYAILPIFPTLFREISEILGRTRNTHVFVHCLRIKVLLTRAIVTLITTRKSLTHLNVHVISLISSMSLMSLIVATVRVHREV